MGGTGKFVYQSFSWYSKKINLKQKQDSITKYYDAETKMNLDKNI